MKIEFICPSYESIGIEYLSAVLKQNGHKTELILDPQLFNDGTINIPFLGRMFDYRDKVVKMVKKSKADLVAFTVLSDQYPWACYIAKKIKEESDVPIVFGGIHPTAMPEQSIKNDFVDYVIRGEGEFALLDLVKSLESGKPNYEIKNVWMKKGNAVIRNELRPLIENLDELPFPDKDVYYEILKFQEAYSYNIMTSRGCLFTCSYCTNSFLKKLYAGKGSYHRLRSVENVIAELKLAKAKYPLKMIVIHDDTFNSSLEWLEKFSSLYTREIALPFFSWINPINVNEKVVALLKNSGCFAIEMGVQAISPETRKNILHRNMSTEQIANSIALFNKAGIWVTTDNIFGLPGQSKQELLDLAKFYNRNRVNLTNIFYMKYFPKIEILDIAKEMGVLSEEQAGLYEQSEHTKYITVSGDVNSAEYSAIKRLFYMLPFLPRNLVDYIIDKGIYKYIPFYTSYTLHGLFMNMLNVLLWRKYHKYVDKYITRYFYFMVRKFQTV